MIKIITAAEMSRIENLAYKEGISKQQFMENAARSIAEQTIAFICAHHLEKRVTLLVGKGNNAGDAFATGAILLEKGFSVSAWHIYPLKACSSLCQLMCKRFQKRGGILHQAVNPKSFDFHPEGVLLDGLVGTGFKGKAEDMLALAIQRANLCGLPILAIDIPSGLNGTTGEVGSVAIQATETIYLELPKWGFFIQSGWDHVGRLVQARFGLDKKYSDKAVASALLFSTDTLPSLLPPIKRTRHKYQAGYVLAIAGSKQMAGAAILSSFSALVSGAGIVRLFHLQNMQAELSAAPYELIKEEWNGSLTRITEESARAKALLIGPGMGRTKQAEAAIKKVLNSTTLPTVIDADALYFIAKHPTWKLPKQSILTPHSKELERLLSSAKKTTHDSIQAFVDQKKVTLVLKTPPSTIFHPHSLPLIIPHGDPGMATAGSGDVLTGIIAGMLAQGLDCKSAALVATALHAIAGEIAAHHLTSYCVTASDIMESLSDAFARFV